ncbi:MAG: pseudouridine synthase [Bacteroidota bacterium]|nr:pseudouridine synthase [Bacteroidota bacterium]
MKKDSKDSRHKYLIRLNKYLSNAGIASRRKADKLIEKGMVEVNGEVVTELGFKVHPNDDIFFKGQKISQEKHVYLLMNKPKNTITTTRDDSGRKTVLDLLHHKVKQQVYPVGRLDRDTTGVLLITNDGKLTQRLTHPSYNKKKVYHVFLDKDLTKADMEKLAEGIDPGDGNMFFDHVAYPNLSDKSEVGVEIHSGRNRIVRRMFEFLEYKVERLDRVFFAGLTKEGLGRGKWRYLTEHEVRRLKGNKFK